MVADGKTDQKQIVVSDWVKELALFRLLDLNKQAYILSYQTTRSDSLTYQYKLKPKEKAPVQLLTIRLNKNSEISQIQAIVQTKNQLYNSEKQLNLNCGKDKKGNWSIKNYSVSGHQKLTMTDKKTFEVVGVILN